MKKLLTILAALMLVTMMGLGSAQATLSWQTAPILGHDISFTASPGDVVVYTDAALPVTIPHVSMVGDLLYDVGMPGVTTFYYNPNVWDGTHWYDPVVNAYSGSGINLDPAHTYSYTGTYDFLGTPGNSAYSVVVASATGFNGGSFIMLTTGVGGFWLEDAGGWKYTETWADEMDQTSITASRNFDVTPVPLPPSVLLLGSGLLGLVGLGWRRKKTS